MNTIELMDAMSFDIAINEQKGGVWSIDELYKQPLKRNKYFIVNTDESNKLGSHWVGIYLPSRGPLEFFDALGKPPEYYHRHLEKWCQSFNSGYLWNNVAYQLSSSTLCGEYCLFYGYYRCREILMQDILKKIKIGDDSQMYQFYVNHFR